MSKNKPLKSKRRPKPEPSENEDGMFCVMCGGPCDMENCGLEQPK